MSENRGSTEDDNFFYVDLDGTLVHTDTLHESIVGVIKKQPLLLLFMPFWLFKGKAYFKDQIAKYFIPTPSGLPYNSQLINLIKKKKHQGHSIILATAANQAIAIAIAKQTGLFDHVLASNQQTNMKGTEKLIAIQKHCQGRPFSYAGDSLADLPIWQYAASAVICGNNKNVRQLIEKNNITIDADLPSRQQSYMHALIRTIRPHQWAKNILVFTSLLLAHKMMHADLLANALIAFTAFCFCASGVYLVNDLLDIESDRNHKYKKNRPLASGQLPVRYAALAIPVFILLSAILAMLLPIKFQLVLGCYFILTLFYSLHLKQIVLLDVILLSLLYTIRIIAGSAAITITTTPWLLGFAMFFFLSLALAKRYSELHNLKSNNQTSIKGRGYHIEDIEQLAIFGSISGYISVLVLALYINSATVIQLYTKSKFLWFICILLIYWISRIWLLARRGILNEDPVVFTLHDKISYFVGLTTALILFISTL